MPLKEIVKKQLCAVIRKCEEQGCKLRLNGFKEILLLKGEKINNDKKMCDCIIFIEEEIYSGSSIVELKSKTVHVNEVIQKLSNSAETALNLWKECSKKINKFELYPIVLAKKWRNSEYKTLTSKKISVGGKKYYIVPGKCGSSLLDLLKRFYCKK